MPISFGPSEVLNIILFGFGVFQLWDASKSKRIHRNGLTAVHEMVSRGADRTSVLSALDGVLANLGGRQPFTEYAHKLVEMIASRFSGIDRKPIATVSPVTREEVARGARLPEINAS